MISRASRAPKPAASTSIRSTEWLIFLDGFSSGTGGVERASGCSTCREWLLLLVTFPLIALFACWFKLDSPGGFFRSSASVSTVSRLPCSSCARCVRSRGGGGQVGGARRSPDHRPAASSQVRIDELPQVWTVLRAG